MRLSELSSKLSSKPNIDVTNIRAAARMLLRQTPLAEEANDASSGTLRRRSRSGGSVPADPMKGGKDMVTAARMAAAAIKALPSAPGVCDARVPPAIAVPDPALPTIVALPSIDSAPIVELPRSISAIAAPPSPSTIAPPESLLRELWRRRESIDSQLVNDDDRTSPVVRSAPPL